MATRLPRSPVFNSLGQELRSPPSLPSPPQFVVPPKYAIGARCRWIPRQHTDWGQVIGHVCLPSVENSNETPQWSWTYLLLLDSDSPSRSWVVADWVDEEHLEILSEQPPLFDSDPEGL